VRYKLYFQALSDPGWYRENNEDAYLTRDDIGLFAVCDGLGGHAAGEVASALAVETLKRFRPPENLQAESPREALLKLVQQANCEILQDQAQNPDHRGMGTTLSALWIPEPAVGPAWVAQVGDSRVYRLRDAKLEQLTEDHSPVFRLFKRGLLTKEELRLHPQKHIVEQTLGLRPEVKCDVLPATAWVDDIFLLCSDGLTDCVSDEEIREICSSTPWKEMASRLVDRALRCGGHDNVTVVLVRIGPEESVSDG
jgi:protein phosphatase